MPLVDKILSSAIKYLQKKQKNLRKKKKSKKKRKKFQKKSVKKRKIIKKKTSQKKSIKRMLVGKTPVKKKRIAKKKVSKKKVKKPRISRKKPPSELQAKKIKKLIVNEKLIGNVTHYFSRIGVIVIKLSRLGLKAGETIHIIGSSTDFKQKVKSLQIESVDVSSAKKGELVGVKVTKKAKEGDRIYIIT